MQIVKLAESSLEVVAQQAAEVLAAGGLVIYPTETVYGVGVDATNAAAVEKLLAYKSRREGKPLSVAVINQAMAEEYVELTEQAKKFYERFLPGPYTIVSKGKGKVATSVESEFGTLGVRIPDYPLVLEMVKVLGRPLTATSANASGEKRPYTVADVLGRLSEKQKSLIDLIIDAGELPRNEPSTVVDTTLATPLVIRGDTIQSAESLVTHSAQETRDLAGKLVLKHWEKLKKQGLLIGLDGPLGAGKTVFAQGVAQFLKIEGPIASPTYTYMTEYSYRRHGIEGMLYHIDAWKIDTPELFAQLNIDQLLQANNVIVVEWWEQVGHWWKGREPDLLVYEDPEDVDEHSRTITFKEGES